MRNFKWQDKISSENLYINTKQKPIVQTFQRKQLEEESKNSFINIFSINHSQDMKNVNNIDQNCCKPNM